jgi:signal transduction histidine kinase
VSFSPHRALIAAGVALVALYFALPVGVQDWLYPAIGAASAVAIGLGTRLNRPAHPLPWLLFAAGNLLFAVGDSLFNALGDSTVADVFYLSGYPPIAAGLAYLMFTSGVEHRRLAALADAAIFTAAFVLLQWVFVLDGVHGWIAALYPLMDVVLLAGFAGFFVSAAWRAPAFFLLVASVVLLVIADEYFALYVRYQSGDWIDAAWLLSYVLWAGAALHPSMRGLSAQTRPTSRLRVSAGRVAVMLGALLTPPLALAIEDVRDAHVDKPAIVTVSTIVSVLVVGRLLGILRALERIRSRERSARADAEQAQRLLAAQNERLVEADRMKDEFVALISHDLRTPLTSIMGYVELALDDDLDVELDGERRGYLEVVARSSQRLLRLVDDLLFVARLQSGRLELAATRLDLNEIARQAAEEARARADAKQLELVVDSNGPVFFEGDRGRVFQLLDNLVSNAIKFTPDGGRVELRVHADGAAVLEVCDTGVGFTPAEAARVFERFYRTDKAVERQVPGTGLGLFIAQAITEAHGGRISAHPRDGGGAVFRVELPLAA